MRMRLLGISAVAAGLFAVGLLAWSRGNNYIPRRRPTLDQIQFNSLSQRQAYRLEHTYQARTSR